MNRLRPCGLAALTALSVLAVILLVTGWGSAAASGIIVFVASNSSNPVRVIPAGGPATILAGLAAAAVLRGRTRATRQHMTVPTVPQLRAQEPAPPWGLTDEVSECADSDIISFSDTSTAKYTQIWLTIFDRLICLRPPHIGAPSAGTRRYTIGAAVCGAVILIVLLAAVQPGAPADSGLAGCTALSGAHQAAATEYPRIRSQFARSQWPDLRAAGTSYVDLAVLLLSARNTDGYETVWFYQRLSIVCARHGRNITTDR